MNLKNKKFTEKKKCLLLFLISLGVLILDQLTKFIVIKNMQLAQSIPILSNIFHLTYIQNTGAGFGLFQQSTSLLIWFSIIVIGLILYFYDAIPKEKSVQTKEVIILTGKVVYLL